MAWPDAIYDQIDGDLTIDTPLESTQILFSQFYNIFLNLYLHIKTIIDQIKSTGLKNIMQ